MSRKTGFHTAVLVCLALALILTLTPVQGWIYDVDTRKFPVLLNPATARTVWLLVFGSLGLELLYSILLKRRDEPFELDYRRSLHRLHRILSDQIVWILPGAAIANLILQETTSYPLAIPIGIPLLTLGWLYIGITLRKLKALFRHRMQEGKS